MLLVFRGRSSRGGFRRGFGDRVMDNERRGEEESTLDSQDLSSAASLERGLYSIATRVLKFNVNL